AILTYYSSLRQLVKREAVLLQVSRQIKNLYSSCFFPLELVYWNKNRQKTIKNDKVRGGAA
ncbi:MAG: hypothetical protein Q4G56_07650, partial [Bacillota bacterium]|nr:hypothetical protein [Bacillota bacterium]